jgi:pimeloyl-ACP methyl ester carboxylesterase
MRLRTLAAGLAGILVSGLALVPLAGTASADQPTGQTSTAPTAATAATAAVAAAVPTPPAIDWTKCTKKFGPQAVYLKNAPGARCGLLTVPIDYADPAAGTLQLPVSRIAHLKGNGSKGAVFTNPGGPGGDGLYLPLLDSFVPKRAGFAYDWYGMTPRGVDRSSIQLTCGPQDSRFITWPVVTSANLETFFKPQVEADVARCANASAPVKLLQQHMKTTDIAMDFESLRLAVGSPQVTWYGASYGTRLGQTYASLYPTTLRAMILDGVIAPNIGYYQFGQEQAVSFEKDMAQMVKWLAKYDRVYHLGSTKKRVFTTIDRAQRRLDRKPADKIGGTDLLQAFQVAVYNVAGWEQAAEALAATINDDNGRPLRRLLTNDHVRGVPDDNGNIAFFSTICSDDTSFPTDWETWKADWSGVVQRAPYLGWSSMLGTYLECRTWPTKGALSDYTVTPTFTGPVLLTSETYDPATPFSGALAAKAFWPGAVLIEGKGGTSHAVSLNGSPCLDNSIAMLLKKGVLPRKKSATGVDLKCPGIPAPNPTRTGGGQNAPRIAVPRPSWFG